MSEPLATCPHVAATRLPQGYSVHKEECTQCFDNDKNPDGVFLCLTCFNGGCRVHAQRHCAVAGHQVVLNIKKCKIDTPKPVQGAAAPQQITTLAVVAEANEVKFDSTYKAICFACKNAEISLENDQIKKVLAAVTNAGAATAKAPTWEAPKIVSCNHTKSLAQVNNPPQLAVKSMTKCNDCELNDNLWLCLTCGNLGCGRRQPDGSGGNGHGLAHFERSGHMVVCKLGTIKPDGTADIFCYGCEDMRLDESLADHLAHFAINIKEQKATGKSMAELELELNQKINFNSLFEDSKESTLAFGPGYTGIQNIGNSCYMASSIQCLFSLPSFLQRYYGEGKHHLDTCRSLRPGECWTCQMSKVAVGLMSGKYSQAPPIPMEVDEKSDNKAKPFRPGPATMTVSKTDEKTKNIVLQPGVPPSMFKKIVAGGHEEFKSSRQQDVAEFIAYFFQQIKQKERNAPGPDPTVPFEFSIEDRLQCTNCKKVKYGSVKATDVTLPIAVDEKVLAEANERANAEAAKAQADREARAKASQVAPQVANTNANAPAAADNAAPAAKPDDKKAADPKKANQIKIAPCTIQACFDEWSKPANVSFNCPECKKSTVASKSQKFESFPDILMVNMRRFTYADWVPKKLDVDVKVPAELGLDRYKGTGVQANEALFPAAAAAAGPVPKQQIVDDLLGQGMGFSENACKRAALATNNQGSEQALQWILDHMGDADINDPLPAGKPAAEAGPPVDEALVIQVQSIMEGLPTERIKHALRQTGMDPARAVDWLMSHMDDDMPDAKQPATAARPDNRPPTYRLVGVITHLGNSPGMGHYVAHVLKEGRWVYFNDSSVTIPENPALGYGYVYFFRRA